MHIFILALFSMSFVPAVIAVVYVTNYLLNRGRGISILDIYWVSGAVSILLSAIGSYLMYLLVYGEIPGLEYTALKAAGISVIVCTIYLIFLRFLLILFKYLKNLFSKIK